METEMAIARNENEMDGKKRVCIKKISAIFLAIAGMAGIGTEAAILTQSNIIYSDLMLLPCLYILYQAYLKCLEHKEMKGFYCLTGSLSVIYSFMLVWGALLDKEWTFPEWKFICSGLSLSTAMYPIVFFITKWIDYRQTAARTTKNNKKVWIVCSVVVAAVWSCAYLAMFPGVYGTDAPTWYYEFSNADVPISSQWSPVYGAIFYGLVKTGENLFGNYNAGFALFSFIQMIFVLIGIVNILNFFSRKFGAAAVVMTTAFFSLIPTHVILALTSAQDPVFAVFLSICLIHLYEMSCNPRIYFTKKSNPIRLIVWMILLCVTRNNGLYALLVMGVFVLLFMREYRKQMLMVLSCVIAAIMFYWGPVYHMIGVDKGTVNRFMLSFPLQQMAYTYNFGHDRLSEEQIGKMQKYLTDEGWHTYQLHICLSDHVMRELDYQAIIDDPAAFISLYLDIFITVPDCYIKGAGFQTFGLWYPNKLYTDGRIYHPYIGYLCYDDTMILKEAYGLDFSVERFSLFPIYDEFLGWLYGKGTDRSGYGGNLSMAFSNIPVLGTLSKAGIYFWMLLYLLFYSIYKKRKEPIVMVGLGIGVYITVLLSPVMMYRYCAPVIFSAPLLISALFGPWRDSGADKDKCG